MSVRLAWLACLLCGSARAALAGDPALPGPEARSQAGRGCVVCHGKEHLEFERGAHALAGVTCTSCHGGNDGPLEVAQAHGSDLASLRDPRASVESCGGCHADVLRMRAFGLRTDQLSLYWTSGHGERLAKEGDAAVATCVSCHGSHGVLRAADPLSPVHPFNQVDTCGKCHGDAGLMARYGLHADGVEQYRRSVHGRALLEEGHRAAPACTDCHGSHGAAPPRVNDVELVCGHCHTTIESFFATSPHAHAPGADSSVNCVSCHSNHLVLPPTSQMFLGEEQGHCGSCHALAEEGAGSRAQAIAKALFTDVQSLASTIESAELDVRAAGGRGLFLGAERGYLDDARGLLVRARAMTHTLSPEALDDVLNRGQAMVGETRESLATKQRIFRDRKIFTAIFLGIALAFAIVLWMYGRMLRLASGGEERQR